jgi:hypothetical protein
VKRQKHTSIKSFSILSLFWKYNTFETNYKKRLIETNNMRRLNMKAYKARGHGSCSGPAKGAKFKRKQWKQKIAYAKSNFGKECDDDDNFNYNLIGAELPTVAAEGEGIFLG